MYPILILREEIVCLVILAFLYFTSLQYPMGKDRRAFNRLTLFGAIHTVFDIITIITVNNQDKIPSGVNFVCHIIYLFFAILYSHEMCNYIFGLCYPESPKRRAVYFSSLSVSFLYLIALPFLPIRYIDVGGTCASDGPAAYVGFAIAFIYILLCLSLLFINRKKLPAIVLRTLFPMLGVLTVMVFCQFLNRQFLFTGAGMTVTTLGFFFSLENPTLVFEQKLMTDALTGVSSRHSYNQDILKMEDEFVRNPSSDFAFVFFDINNLRSVNAQFGHQEGDRNITFIASTLTMELKNAKSLYRMGGDEFLAVYYRVDEETIRTELRRVYDICAENASNYKYPPSVATGYAVSSPNYKTLLEVIRTADYTMYKNKEEMKTNKAFVGVGTCSHLNLTGLTDRLFSAMCSSNDRTYPFVTNMDTGVTRVSPGWAKYFGLGGEFHADFFSVWTPHIHPTERNDYIADLTAVLNGKQRYHRFVYRALNCNGEYVTCTCHGAIYHGADGEPDIFAGYLVNHGVREAVDPLTGLSNFMAIDDRIYNTRVTASQAILLKLRINNLSRLNMLYGYEGGNRILCAIAAFLTDECKSFGELFCQDGHNFTFYFNETPREVVTEFYARISDLLVRGIPADGRTVPVNISAGAFELLPECTLEDKVIRRSLQFALDESTYSRQDKLVFYDTIAAGGSDAANFDLLTDIHLDAMNEKSFFRLRYQPIVDSVSGAITGAEALIRWVHPTRGEIEPSRFIAFLENDPCFYSLGSFILDRSLADAKRWRESIPDFRISVNITALQLQHEKFLPMVLESLARNDYPANGLILELTERCKELDIAFLAVQIAALRREGVLVAFDDMGTGYSTGGHLLNIPIDEIKLDREFVLNMMNKSGYQLFADALVRGSVSSATGYVVCFEGVETQEMLDFIRSYGRSVSQGYFFAKPLFADEFDAYLAEHG